MSTLYQIIIEGHLDPRWTDWFDGFAITHNGNGKTILSGDIRDQAALHGVLSKVRDLNLPLIAVARVEGESLWDNGSPSHSIENASGETETK